MSLGGNARLFPLCRCVSGAELLHELLDRRLELAVAGGEIVLRRVFDKNIGFHAQAFHISVFLISEINTNARGTDRGPVYKRIAAGADDRSHRRRAYYFAEAQG